jgi:hypothetical protein
MHKLTNCLAQGLQTLSDLQNTMDKGEVSSALVHLYKSYAAARLSAL